MSLALKASAHNFPALAVSLLLHGSLLLPLLGGAWAKTELPNSVAMDGTSVEVDAPKPELAAAPGEEREIAVEAEAETESESETETESESETEKAPPPPPTPEPARARPRSHPRPPANPSAATAPSSAAPSSAAAGADAPSGTPAPGTFGAEGLERGVRRLGHAFTRAIPPATRGDQAWQELPAGLVGTIRVELSVGEDNRLGKVESLPPRKGEPPTPAALERMVQRTVIMLRAGQFALSGSNEPGKELLIIEVRLRDEPPDVDAKGGMMRLGNEPATPGRPGRAHFRYDTGRVFEAKVTTMPAPN